MTVIAWDGETLAADKQVSKFGLKYTTTKIFRVGAALAGISGDATRGKHLVEWIRAGENPSDYPKLDNDEHAATIMVIRADKTIQLFERNSPHAYTVEDAKWAEGSGRDVALTAMLCGRSAHDAIELACQMHADCGNGIDVLTLAPPKDAERGAAEDAEQASARFEWLMYFAACEAWCSSTWRLGMHPIPRPPLGPRPSLAPPASPTAGSEVPPTETPAP